jgi:CubicO group peptidase (beta-lactamase class C family)
MSLYAFIPLLTGQLSQNKPNLDLLAAQPLGISRDINSFPSLNGLAGRPRGDGAFTGIDALLALVGKGEEPGAKPGKLIPREIEGGKVFVLDDFENPDLSNNWTLIGDSFRSGRSFDGATYNQRTQDPSAQIKGFEGKQFAFSFEGRNSYTGKAVSKEFTIAWDQISFDIMGGTSDSTRIDLVVVNDSGTEQAVRTTTGDGTLNFTRKNWIVKSYIGKTAKLVITDDSAAASYGFIGVDNIRGEMTAAPGVGAGGKVIPAIDFNNLPLQASLKQLANGWQSSYNLPGIWCALIKNGKVVACVAQGTKNINTGAAASVNDLLAVGSVSKPITGMFVAQFVQQGLIKYDTRVQDVFPEFRVKYPNSPLLNATLRQLLSHTGGAPEGEVPTVNSESNDGRLRRYGTIDNLFKDSKVQAPGSGYKYSGSGIILAVAMVEKAAGEGRSLENWMTSEEARSFGITNVKPLFADYIPSGSDVFPHFMDPSFRTWINDKANPARIKLATSTCFDPAGSYSMTLVDLCNFTLACIENTPGLSRDVYNECFTRVDAQTVSDTSAGWHVATKGYSFHEGNTARGEWAVIQIDPKNRSGMIIYTNANYPSATNPLYPDSKTWVRKDIYHEMQMDVLYKLLYR